MIFPKLIAAFLLLIFTGCTDKVNEANTNNNGNNYSIESKSATNSNITDKKIEIKDNNENKQKSEPSAEEMENKAISKPKYTKISSDEAKKIIDTQKDIVLLDVRTGEEYIEQRIPGSLLIPYDIIEKEAPHKLTDKNKKILIYCRSGRRSAIAAESLLKMGYTNVFDFGGINDWKFETQSGTPQ